MELVFLNTSPTLGRCRRGWEVNIRVDLNKIGLITRNSVDLVQDRDYWRALAAFELWVV